MNNMHRKSDQASVIKSVIVFLQVRICGSLWGEADFGGPGKEGVLLEFANTELGDPRLLPVEKNNHLVYSALVW